MSDREFTDEEANNYLNAKHDSGREQWGEPYLDYARTEMQRLVEAGWTSPPPPRFYVIEVIDGTQVRDREGLRRLWAGFYGPSKDDNRRDAEEYAARLNELIKHEQQANDAG